MNQFNPMVQMQLEQARRLKRAEEARRMNQMPIESPFIRGVQKGATYGTADEIGGAIHGPARRDAIRALDEKAAEEAPWSMMGGEVAGELASLLVPGGLFMKGAKAMKTPGKMALGAILGGAAEGGRGFATGQDGMENRLQEAGLGAGIGATVGGALPGVAPAARGVKRALQGPSRATDEGRRKFMKQGGAATALATLAGGAMMPSPGTAAKVTKAVAEAGAKNFVPTASNVFARMADGVNPELSEGLQEMVMEVAARKGDAAAPLDKADLREVQADLINFGDDLPEELMGENDVMVDRLEEMIKGLN